ncbi:class I SAM-dependent methyltransferase [Sphaerisporangium album]|nr:class I SAM-dependent methyltransferase [Sphaerisporangium album]
MSDTAEGPTPSYRKIVGRTREAYDRNASEYGSLTAMYESFPGLKNEVISFVRSAPAEGAILDLGAGGGRDSRYISTLGRAVVAADISLSMIRHARSGVATDIRAGMTGPVGYVQSDILDLPFADRAFSGVWACASLLHLPSVDLVGALKEIARVLRFNGVVSISMKEGAGEGWRHGGSLQGARWFTLTTPAQILDMLSIVGFDGMASRYSGREGWFVATARKFS